MNMLEKNKLFCFGYGYTSGFLAEALKKTGEWEISGTTRSMQKRAILRDMGIDAHIFNKDKPLADPQFALEDVTHCLISTPPDAHGDLVYDAHGDDITRYMPNLKWLGYLSTTAVYGDRDGGSVDEKSEVRPSSIRGTRRMMAEQQWLSLLHGRGVPVHIFRLSGIYGPGRSAIDSVKVGIARRIVKPGHAFCRIHVEDIIQTLIASINNPKSGAIYNVSDDEAAPSHEVIAYAARLLGKEPPPIVRFEDANLAPITLSFYSDNKRVQNTKIKNELGVKLKYPNYRIGLEGCLDDEKRYAELKQTPPWTLLATTESGGAI